MNNKNKLEQKINPNWWDEKHAFFGQLYMEGDNSQEGYLVNKKLDLKRRTKNDIDGVINLLKLSACEHILDVPCGYGRHSIELSKRGFCVTGSDLNETHLKEAAIKAKEKKAVVQFKKENMLEIKYNNKFDCLINMCYSFGFFETDAENMEVLKKFYQALKPGGKFLMETDVNLPYVRAGKFKEEEIRTLKSGNKLKITERYNPHTKRMDGSWTIIKDDGRSITRDYSVRVYEKEEFEKMCLKIGFKKCTAYSNWLGHPYEKKAQQIIFVSKK